MPVDWVSAQACPYDKKNGKEGCEAVRLINIVEEMGQQFRRYSVGAAFVVVLPDHMHLDINMADLASKLSLVKGVVAHRVCVAGCNFAVSSKDVNHTFASPGHDQQDACLGARLRHSASANELNKMPEWFFSVPMENLWSNLGVELFRAPQGQWIFSKRQKSGFGLLASTGGIS